MVSFNPNFRHVKPEGDNVGTHLRSARMKIKPAEQLRHGIVFIGIIVAIGGIVEFASRRREARHREAEAKFFQDVQKLRELKAKQSQQSQQ